MRLISSVCLAVVLFAWPLRAEEGKWTPQQVLARGPAWVKAQGFEPAAPKFAAPRLLGVISLPVRRQPWESPAASRRPA
jgi:hypothetical protein